MRRSTNEQLMLVLTAIACFVIVLVAVTISVIEIRDPSADTSGGVKALTHVVQAVLGVLLGVLICRGPDDKNEEK